MDKGNCRFIIVDDDPMAILVTEIYIRKETEHSEIKSFTLASQALKYLEEEYNQADQNVSTVLLLDLQMPIMDGFEFLQHFEKLPLAKAKIKIVALSVFPDKRERQKAMHYSYVTEYYPKPLTSQFLKHLIMENGFEL
jgi:CheY-like chemotaxis protein